MEFVTFIGEDKESWGQIKGIINHIDSEKIFIIKDNKTEGFPINPKMEIINIDSDKDLLHVKEDIVKILRGKLSKDFEVALSLASGNGKEHMALISALLSIPVGIRLVVFTKKGIEWIN